MPTCRVGPWYFPLLPSLRGRRLKGKGKGDLGARETRGAPLAFPSRPKPPSLPFQTPVTQANCFQSFFFFTSLKTETSLKGTP